MIKRVPAIFFQIWIHLQLHEANFFLLLMPCPSVFLQLHQASRIFLSMLSYFFVAWIVSLEPTLMLLELPMGGIFILFLCLTARRMALIQVWLACNHSLVLAPFFPSHFQQFFCLCWKTTLLKIFLFNLNLAVNIVHLQMT